MKFIRIIILLQFELLPAEMSVAVSNSCLNSGHVTSANSLQVSKLAHNRRYCSEFPFFDKSFAEPCCNLQVRVCENGTSTSLVKKAAALIPEFSINVEGQNTGRAPEWQLCTPQILQLFQNRKPWSSRKRRRLTIERLWVRTPSPV